LLSLRGRSPDRSVEPFDSRAGEGFPADDGVRLRVVRSTLQHATSARGDAKLSPLRGRDCPEQFPSGVKRDTCTRATARKTKRSLPPACKRLGRVPRSIRSLGPRIQRIVQRIGSSWIEQSRRGWIEGVATSPWLCLHR